MLASSHENATPEYSPGLADDLAAVAALTAQVDAAGVRIAAALAPEPYDWNRHWQEIVATITAQAARLDVLTTDGGS